MHPASKLVGVSITRHWNGHPLHSYHSVCFRWRNVSVIHSMSAVVFADAGKIAVLSSDGKSYPGHIFEEALRREIAAWEEKREKVA
jgi:hypothetical protein